MSTQSLNILAVDDDRVTLELLTLVLEEYTDGEVLTFDDSQAAIEAIQQRRGDIHLVTSDMVMPVKTGLDVLKAYRNEQQQAPFLMVTANATREIVLDACKLGANGFLTKPFATNDLLDKLDNIVNPTNS
jgi:DNA-binding NtrC family response regulator